MEWNHVLAEAFSLKFIILYVFIASGLYVHFRGREKLGFVRQLTDHSTFLAPYNVFVYAFSKIRNTPILEKKDFPDVSLLRENWETIREEAMKLYEMGHIKKSDTYNDLAFNSFFKRGWKRFYLKWYDDFLPSAKDMCPKTVELVEKIPSVNAAMFTLLPAKSELMRHRDPFAGSVRYHLGLITPNSESCYIDIDGTPYAWKDGDDIFFDETFIHKAKNETDVDRLILFCDIERPLRTPLARGINRFVNNYIVKTTSTSNVDGEKVGFFNKIFGWVYQIRIVTKKVKEWNTLVYYILKFALLGAIFYWIFFG
jgi:beta-hydroxylase